MSTTTAVLRLGTRASALATTQSGLVADLIRERLGREVELVEVSTEGDRSAAPLATLGGWEAIGWLRQRFATAWRFATRAAGYRRIRRNWTCTWNGGTPCGPAPTGPARSRSSAW